MTVSNEFWQQIRQYAQQTLQLTDIAATNTDLTPYLPYFNDWIEKGYHADLTYMTKHGDLRWRPDKLVPGTQSVIVATLNYLPEQYSLKKIRQRLTTPSNYAAISYYAQGRDYHKVLRKKLEKLAQYITQQTNADHTYRVFTDSAPVLEKPLAEKSGLGWIGKHGNLMNRNGSFFFIGVIFTSINFQNQRYAPYHDHCGRCQACITQCPTGAIVANKVVDANRCLSYLTIENKGGIPLEFRRPLGNRIYGCDDCQLVCPFNQSSQTTSITDFLPRSSLTPKRLIELAQWDEPTFLQQTQGSAIRRIGHWAWIRNIVIALGNAPFDQTIIHQLKTMAQFYQHDPVVSEHINWALNQHLNPV